MEASVGFGYGKALFDFAVSCGAEPERLVAQSGFDPRLGQNTEARVPFLIFKRLMLAAKALCQDPALALRFGAETQFVDMSIVGLITHSASTMGEAFEQMNRYAKLAIDVLGETGGQRFSIIRRAGETWIEDLRPQANDFPELTESTFARFVWNTARHLGAVPFAKHMCFTHAKPSYWQTYERILGVSVEFECERNAIAFHESWLSIKLPQPNQYVFGIFLDRASSLLIDLEQTSSLAGKVEGEILSKLHTGCFGIEDIGRKLGLSRTTLYRKLKNEGTTFESIVDTLRCRVAVDYLKGGKISVSECAYLVGFSDPAAFSRAFKKWTGTNPSEARRQLGQYAN